MGEILYIDCYILIDPKLFLNIGIIRKCLFEPWPINEYDFGRDRKKSIDLPVLHVGSTRKVLETVLDDDNA